MQTIAATKFKAQCLAILDEVAATGESVTILKRGKPVAQLVPPTPSTKKYPQEDLFGTVTIHGDIMEPVLPADAWDAERGELLD
jgi:prevent-host-death family protein